MIILPVTLTAAGLAALLNIWIANRVGRVRGQEKVSIGDGGNARLDRGDARARQLRRIYAVRFGPAGC